VLGRSHADAVLKQDAAAATLQGEPFSTWAGPVSLVGGLEYRKESTVQVADDLSKTYTPAFPLGGWQFGNRASIDGGVRVSEYFAETVVPLLKNWPLAQSLELNAAARSTDYSTSGKVTTWKLGVTYSPVKDVLFRATKSRDIRAPNPTELFQSRAANGAGSVIDYGRPGNPQSNVSLSSEGNPNLVPEKANTKTIGVTWEPSQIPGFHAAVDVYKILLNNNIALVAGSDVVASCYGAAGYPATPANCALISRDTSGGPGVIGAILNVRSTYNNQAYQKDAGMDIELGYRFPLNRYFGGVPGNLSLRVLGTYLDELTTNNFRASIDNAGTVGLPHWRWTASSTYTNGPLTVYLQGRFTEDTVISANPLATDVGINNIPSRFYLNTSVQYVLFDKPGRGRLALYGNIDNLLDKDPPLNPGATTQPNQAAFAADYDRIGRAFTVGLRFAY
jgi:outer membrane receptor protein involved in Fe transport